MKNQFITMRFGIEMAIAIALAGIMLLAVRLYNPAVKTKTIKVDYFRIPTNNALVVLGLLVPILTALAAYLYTSDPSGQYSFLLASISVLFVVLIVAIWETFALLGKAQDGDLITVTLPADRPHIVCMGVMYGFLLLGLMYFALFFLFELSPTKTTGKQGEQNLGGSYSLMKPAARIGQQKDDLMKSWGQPAGQDSVAKTLTYQSERSQIRLTFDDEGKLVEVLEKGR
jgi:hypothetical protein